VSNLQGGGIMNINISLSALNSFSRTQEVISNNVANVNTDGYNSKRVILEEAPNDQGVRVQQIREERNNVQNAQNDKQPERNESNNNPVPQNNVELEREFTDMIQNQNAYNANAQVVRTENQMVGELINKLV